jgi:mannonate dehydratase
MTNSSRIKFMPKIVSARVIVTCPGRNFVTLKIETAGGISGIGDATLNGRELAVASYLAEHVIPALVGRDSHQIEDIWHCGTSRESLRACRCTSC